MTELWICPKAGECKNECPAGHNKPHEHKAHSLFYCSARDSGEEILACIPYVGPTVKENLTVEPQKKNPYPVTVKFNDLRYVDKVAHDCWEQGYQAGVQAERERIIGVVEGYAKRLRKIGENKSANEFITLKLIIQNEIAALKPKGG
jgi:hypothetical protein